MQPSLSEGWFQVHHNPEPIDFANFQQAVASAAEPIEQIEQGSFSASLLD
jgi:hypothetical protein